jgi:SAM-dependent methyltransferase
MNNEFDLNTDQYKQAVDDSISLSGLNVSRFTIIKCRHILRLAAQFLKDTKSLSLLDVGCGIGLIDQYLIPYVQHVYGIDLSGNEITCAKRNNPTANYVLYDGDTLPYKTESFDLAFGINVMHHLHPTQWSPFLQELKRVTKKGGMAIVMEHNPLNPLTRLAIFRCSFDKDAALLRRRALRELFHNCGLAPIASRYIVYFPWNYRLNSAFERVLGSVPGGAQYYIAAIK